MKLIWSTLSLLFLSAWSAPTPVPTSPSSGSKPIMLVAHRGGAARAPENTLAAFKNGLALGADYLEMDVHLSKDGVPVVIHDPKIDRTTDGVGRVSDYTVAQLQEFNAAAKFPGGWAERQVIPTFAQVLDLAKDSAVHLEVEIKWDADNHPYPGIEQKVLDELATRGMLDRVKIMAFEFDALKRIRAINSRVPIIALLYLGYFLQRDVNQPVAVIDDMVNLGVDGIGINKDLVTPALVQEAHRRDLLVGVWTVDAEAEMERIAAMGVDSITSNRPDALKSVVGGGR